MKYPESRLSLFPGFGLMAFLFVSLACHLSGVLHGDDWDFSRLLYS